MNEETIHNLITFEDTLAQYISDENVQKCVAFSQNNIKYYNGKEKIDITMTINSKKDDKKSNKDDSGLTISERIEKLETQISDLTSSSVYQTIDKKHISLVTSPIKKTNVILKNVNFQYAVKLWNYMQTHMEDDTKKDKGNNDYYDDGKIKTDNNGFDRPAQVYKKRCPR